MNVPSLLARKPLNSLLGKYEQEYAWRCTGTIASRRTGIFRRQ